MEFSISDTIDPHPFNLTPDSMDGLNGTIHYNSLSKLIKASKKVSSYIKFSELLPFSKTAYKSLPREKGGVYIFVGEDRETIYYIGKTTKFYTRIVPYINPGSKTHSKLIDLHICKFRYICLVYTGLHYDTAVEKSMIEYSQPKCNTRGTWKSRY